MLFCVHVAKNFFLHKLLIWLSWQNQGIFRLKKRTPKNNIINSQNLNLITSKSRITQVFVYGAKLYSVPTLICISLSLFKYLAPDRTCNVSVFISYNPSVFKNLEIPDIFICHIFSWPHLCLFFFWQLTSLYDHPCICL